MKKIRLSLIGFGTVGRGFAELLVSKQALLRQKYDVEVTLVSVANARHGFIYREVGLDITTLLELARTDHALTEYPGVHYWATAQTGLLATDADVMVEVTGTNLHDAEPGISHIRTALSQGMHVITANKGPGALAAHELLALAQQHGKQLRMESTVMAGTPVLSTLQEGMAGATVKAIRGILNGTTNYILSAMAAGREYSDVLTEAQSLGYAESDPTADVEGYDALAKTLILAALAFGKPLKPEQVQLRGITSITSDQMVSAVERGHRIKLIASLRLDPEAGTLDASIEPVELPLHDPLARVDGVLNAITIESDTLPEVTIIGPGAGPIQTAQGLLSDLIAIGQSLG
jgi:homoserine dehydrogenase